VSWGIVDNPSLPPTPLGTRQTVLQKLNGRGSSHKIMFMTDNMEKCLYVKYKRDIKLYIQNNNYVNTPRIYAQKCREEHLTSKD
jgi:hypothetical protein